MAVGVDLHHAELRGCRGDRYPKRADGDIGLVLHVIIQQPGIVHFINVVAGQDDDELGPFFFDGIDVLIHGVGGALVPMLVDALLGRHDVDKFAQFPA